MVDLVMTLASFVCKVPPSEEKKPEPEAKPSPPPPPSAEKAAAPGGNTFFSLYPQILLKVLAFASIHLGYMTYLVFRFWSFLNCLSVCLSEVCVVIFKTTSWFLCHDSDILQSKSISPREEANCFTSEILKPSFSHCYSNGFPS